jgi:hypothetical protein
MMSPELLSQLPSLGVSGLLFVMWWFERQDRVRNSDGLHEALQHAGRMTSINSDLLDVIGANTEALTALRGELRSHRMTETELLGRLERQLEDLA